MLNYPVTHRADEKSTFQVILLLNYDAGGEKAKLLKNQR